MPYCHSVRGTDRTGGLAICSIEQVSLWPRFGLACVLPHLTAAVQAVDGRVQPEILFGHKKFWPI